MDNLHTIGPWYTNYGSMFNKYNDGVMLDEDIAILVTIDAQDGIGTLHKVGKVEPLKQYMDMVVNKYLQNGFTEMASEWKLIQFFVKYEELNFTPDGYNLDIDEVCTLINWFQNCSCQNMKAFFELSLEAIKGKIADLQRIGY